jgi:hypothetical protein
MDFPITRGSSQNPYQEYTFVLPANGKRIINDVYNFFVLLSQSVANSLSVRFGDNGRITNLSREAINLNFTEVFERIEFINRTASAVTVTVALGIGIIIDTRIAGATSAGTVTVAGTVAVSGTVTVGNVTQILNPVTVTGSVGIAGGYIDNITSPIETRTLHTNVRSYQYTVDDTTPTQITIGDDKTRRVLIYGNSDFYIGNYDAVNADTAFLQKTTFQPIELWNAQKIYAKHPSGSAITDTIFVIEEYI